MRSFTFVEAMVSTLVLGLIIAGIFMLLLISDRTYHTDVGLLDLQQFTRRAIEQMVEELRVGSGISISSGLNNITFNGSLCKSPCASINYSLSGNQLIRLCDGQSKIMASRINVLSFCWCHGSTCTPGVDCDNVQGTSNVIAIQLRSTNTIRGKTVNFPATGPMKEQVRLRNE